MAISSVLVRSRTMRFVDNSLTHETVLMRGDCNVPLAGGGIADNSRLVALMPTIKLLLINNNKIILASHMGRPKASDPALSMRVVANFYAEALPAINVVFCESMQDAQNAVAAGTYGKTLAVIENLRFHPGEESNSPEFSKSLASLATVYVNDAFACSHRAHASVVGITKFLPSYAGLLMQNELSAIEAMLNNQSRPSVAIIGGSKISTKTGLITNLVGIMDHIVVGGGIANYMLQHYMGYKIGRSLVESGFNFTVDDCTLEKLVLPSDVIVTKDYTAEAPKYREADIADITPDEMIVDIGSKTIAKISSILGNARMVVWNGPLGLFEYKPFDKGSAAVGRKIVSLTVDCKLRSLIGGGDTIRLVRENGLLSSFSHVSTGGGALLEMLSGKDLPGLMALM